jgi:hypothetical protein
VVSSRHPRNPGAGGQPDDLVREALRLLVERCPKLAKTCYWAGTSAISLEELRHRSSLDIDLHTKRALEDVRPILIEIQRAFPGDFALIEAPDDSGSGFRGVLGLPGGRNISIEILSNYEDVPAPDLVDSTTVPHLERVSLARYLADKVQYVVERVEARDLVDIGAVLRQHPELTEAAKRLVFEQDDILLSERLLAWTGREIEEDLRAYPDADPEHARRTRDLLLSWIRAANGRAP